LSVGALHSGSGTGSYPFETKLAPDDFACAIDFCKRRAANCQLFADDQRPDRNPRSRIRSGASSTTQRDGKHRVYQVEFPSPAIDGVVVADETITESMNLQEGISLDRYVFFTRKRALDLDRLWAAGVRHVIHADCRPRSAG